MKQRNSKIDKQIGMRLRQIRILRDLSQSQLGAELGVTFQQVQKYESGTNAIASSRMPALCKALGITPDELYRVDVQTQPINIVTTAIMRTAIKLEKLSSFQRNAVNVIIEAFEKEKSDGDGRAA
jgi:transcriptional regulator with XRE-family HTH domain